MNDMKSMSLLKMILQALGLLLGQIAVLSMQRFFKTLPRKWFREHLHPIVRRILRCGLPADSLKPFRR
ncbi:unnamed protein product [Thelazia callipaeda]|uniref:Inner membrane protein n=1 Tax=Thelazia callipaeda TaxID=103827 RepID=A0A0N5CRU6_THECL|nr:unnamed protein product [Thelazia callipaeda]